MPTEIQLPLSGIGSSLGSSFLVSLSSSLVGMVSVGSEWEVTNVNISYFKVQNGYMQP
jgi:hypothetical protein